MKKRIIVLAMTVILSITALAGCQKKQECDFCGEMKHCKEYSTLAGEIYVCDDCKDKLDEELQ